MKSTGLPQPQHRLGLTEGKPNNLALTFLLGWYNSDFTSHFINTQQKNI